MTTLKVNDRKPSKAEPDWPGDVETFVIGSPMGNATRHPLDILAEDRSPVPKIILSTDSTHKD